MSFGKVRVRVLERLQPEVVAYTEVSSAGALVALVRTVPPYATTVPMEVEIFRVLGDEQKRVGPEKVSKSMTSAKALEPESIKARTPSRIANFLLI